MSFCGEEEGYGCFLFRCMLCVYKAYARALISIQGLLTFVPPQTHTHTNNTGFYPLESAVFTHFPGLHSLGHGFACPRRCLLSIFPCLQPNGRGGWR